MAIMASIPSKAVLGEAKRLYLRVNNISVSNHGEKSQALFRGYSSSDDFKCGEKYIYEKTIHFNADVGSALWTQAYNAFKSQSDIDMLLIEDC